MKRKERRVCKEETKGREGHIKETKKFETEKRLKDKRGRAIVEW